MDENAGTALGFIDFLRWAGDKGEVSTATANGWLAASRAVLAVYDDPDHVAIRDLDVEQALTRFENKSRTKYNTASMAAYKRRFQQAVGAYLAWLDGDQNWNSLSRANKSARSATQRSRKRASARNAASAPTTRAPESVDASAPEPPAAPHGMVAYDLPLRPNLRARLTLPADLTTSDAERISAFVRSLAFPDAPGAQARVSSKAASGG